jgi:predicted transcriptional regulator
MPMPHSETLAEFHKFVGQQLTQPEAASMSPEEALARWREHQETLAAIREGLKDIDSGRTRPVDELIQELKSSYSLP